MHVWRRIEKRKLRFKPTWTGPAIVIAHEPSSSEVQQNSNSGTKEPPRPGSVVRVVMGGRVIKAAPEHLRLASTLEPAGYDFNNPAKPLADDLQKVLESAVGKQFEDVHSQEPPPMDADPFDRDASTGPSGQPPDGVDQALPDPALLLKQLSPKFLCRTDRKRPSDFQHGRSDLRSPRGRPHKKCPRLGNRLRVKSQVPNDRPLRKTTMRTLLGPTTRRQEPPSPQGPLHLQEMRRCEPLRYPPDVREQRHHERSAEALRLRRTPGSRKENEGELCGSHPRGLPELSGSR